jgi:hypothetical protein
VRSARRRLLVVVASSTRDIVSSFRMGPDA